MGQLRRRAPSGFTLMELLIVVIIIGVLSTLALPQFAKAVDQSRESEAISIISSGLTAQFAHFQEKGRFTANTTDLVVLIPIMKHWTLPGTAPNFTWTVAADGASVSIIADSLGHGHATPTDHQIRGSIDSAGAKVLSRKRPGEPGFTPF